MHLQILKLSKDKVVGKVHLFIYIGFNFILYSFIGWIIEELYSFARTKSFKKEGFLIGPIKPMYGIAMTILIMLNQALGINNLPLLFLCFLVPTTVEYISGYMLKNYFHKEYWNYSHMKHNINGYVSLRFSVYWTFLSFIGVYFFQPFVYKAFILTNGTHLRVFVIGALIIMTYDLITQINEVNLEK